MLSNLGPETMPASTRKGHWTVGKTSLELPSEKVLNVLEVLNLRNLESGGYGCSR